MSTAAGGGRRSRTWLVSLLALAVGAGGGYWAGAQLLSPPPDVLEAPSYALVESATGSVGRTINVIVSARWGHLSTVAGRAQGTVTSRNLVERGAAQAGQVAEPSAPRLR